MSLSPAYRVGGAALGVAGIIIIFVGGVSDAAYVPVAGVAVFAVLYVIAQAVERLVEWITEGLKLIPDSPGAKKTRAVRAIRDTNLMLTAMPNAVDRSTLTAMAATEKVAEESRTDIRFLGHGLSILLCAIAVNWLNYGLMGSLGATDLNPDFDRLLTALAAAGGSKGLHELIGRVQASKENAQTAS